MASYIRKNVIMACVVIALVLLTSNFVIFLKHFQMRIQLPIPARTTPIQFVAHNQLPLNLKDIRPQSNGKVDIVLSVNVLDLYGYIDAAIALQATRPTPQVAHIQIGIVVQNPDLCMGNPHLKWIIYIHTAPGNFERRNNIRSTWGNHKLFKKQITQLVFMVGSTNHSTTQDYVMKEFTTHQDIVQGNFIDSYKNLTVKALMALKWVSTYCKHIPFVLKADDDAFVNIFQLLDEVEKHDNGHKLLSCALWSKNTMPILRDPKTCMKWCVKYMDFPGQKFFPQYCAGLSYILSQSLIPELLDAAKTTPYFWIDDIYITGLLTAKIKDIHYMNMHKHFSLKANQALEQYNNTMMPITLYMVHATKSILFNKLWERLLHRLSVTQLKLLTEDVINQYPRLILKLNSVNRTI